MSSAYTSLLTTLEGTLSNTPFSIDTRQVRFRFLKKEDINLWTEFVNGCSKESLWLRFMVPFSATLERAQRFCDIDPEKELAIVAEMNEDERSRAIGIARLAKLSGTDKAEFAVIVSDPWQKKKLGYTLSNMGIDLVRQWGAKSVFSETFMENHAMIKVLKRCRYRVEERNGNMLTMSLNLAGETQKIEQVYFPEVEMKM